jgi:serine/threonine-protein kinase
MSTTERIRPLGIEGYQVGEEIGRGAQGVVYKASKDGRPCALKVLRPEANEQEIVRFERAIEAIRLLADVPGVVHVLEHGRTALGSPWYAMELVNGRSLRAVLDDGSLDPREAVNVLVDAAYAVHDANDRGIVHRDLKPENVLVEMRADGSAVAKIADFGLARDIYAGATASSGGTPVYMSPEQVLGGEITRRTDVHALGIVLYEVVAGVAPFRHEALHELAKAIAEQRPRPPEMAWCGLPETLAEVILRALEKDPDARYPTAGALAAEVERALRGETIGGVPLRPWRVRGGPIRQLVSRIIIFVVLRRNFFQGLVLGLFAGIVAGTLLRHLGWLGAPFAR